MSDHFPIEADIKCRIVKNENGTFLVFENNVDADEASKLFSTWDTFACFGDYENALVLKYPSDKN